MKNEKQERVRSRLIASRLELDFARRYPYFTCDVCGPYGHTFHVCYSAVAKSIEAFIYFHDHDPEGIYDLKRLVTLAAADTPGFERCMSAVLALEQCGKLTGEDYTYKPTQGELDEAIQLAEDLIAFVSSTLPEDVRR